MLSSLNPTPNTNNPIDCVPMNTKEEINPFSTFKSMLEAEEDDWYIPNSTLQNHQDINFSTNLANPDNLLLHPVDSSSSCSPNSSVFNNLDPSLLNGFDLGEIGFLENQPALENASSLLNRGNGILGNFTDLSSNNQISSSNLCPENFLGFSGFRGFDQSQRGNSLVLNRSELLGPLGNIPSMGGQPTLFQKRQAQKDGNIPLMALAGIQIDKGEKKRKFCSLDDFEGLNYDSDEFTESTKMEEIGKNGGNSSNGDRKGKKKGPPAKNLMAERRRRKKLNDRLYVLRSVVPKISKLDRASILGDAIEYLKELLQRINDLHNELESTRPSSSLTPAATLNPLTPAATPNSQLAKVEVRVKEGGAVNIHMFCGRRQGLLGSTIRALDSLGLDIKQAVISCFSGFTMDIFQAEFEEGQNGNPEHIRAVLVDSAAVTST